MPQYTYVCPSDGPMELSMSMNEVATLIACPQCGADMKRDFRADLSGFAEIWACQGAHKTDYDATGDKLEKLNRSWSKMTGEEPPPVSSEIKRNNRGKQ